MDPCPCCRPSGSGLGVLLADCGREGAACDHRRGHRLVAYKREADNEKKIVATQLLAICSLAFSASTEPDVVHGTTI